MKNFIETKHIVVEVDCTDTKADDWLFHESEAVSLVFTYGNHHNVAQMSEKYPVPTLSAAVPSDFFPWFVHAHRNAVAKGEVLLSEQPDCITAYWEDLFNERTTIPVTHCDLDRVRLKHLRIDHPHTDRMRAQSIKEQFQLGRAAHFWLPLQGEPTEIAERLRWLSECTISQTGADGFYWVAGSKFKHREPDLSAAGTGG